MKFVELRLVVRTNSRSFPDNVQEISLTPGLTHFVKAHFTCTSRSDSDYYGTLYELLHEPQTSRLGKAFALFRSEEHSLMPSRITKLFIATLSLLLLAAALTQLTHRHSATSPRPLLLLGGGLISLANLSRRHFADEEE
jgi:hypothetical protein